ncbi:MAG TPA: type II toxin-antitoxin system RelE/ParE family toxin [Pyrinomonadaceae bacterium]|nr:type II toxin-antitoxin system RelE/ParE family toxin [Pyrinomonadaceae bacterium]
MAYRIEWSPRAIEDLEEIARYVSHDSSAYSRAVVRKILEISRKFSQFPLAGRMVPEFSDENIREWFAYSYRIIHQVEDDAVIIAAIVHGKRLLNIQ